MYARGINDDALVQGDDRFLHIVSCNTHNIAVLVKMLAMDEDGTNHLDRRPLPMHAAIQRHLPGLRFRSIAHGGTAQGPEVRHPSCPRCPWPLRDHRLRPQPLLVGPQAQHPVHALDPFLLDARSGDRPSTRSRSGWPPTSEWRSPIGSRPTRCSPSGATTATSAGSSPRPWLRSRHVAIRNGNEVVGFCFTPQDGNPLLSTLAATLWYMDPDGWTTASTS